MIAIKRFSLDEGLGATIYKVENNVKKQVYEVYAFTKEQREKEIKELLKTL